MNGKLISIAWELFKKEHPKLFADAASGRYLENRLEVAFQAGIVTAEAVQREAASRQQPHGGGPSNG